MNFTFVRTIVKLQLCLLNLLVLYFYVLKVNGVVSLIVKGYFFTEVKYVTFGNTFFLLSVSSL